MFGKLQLLINCIERHETKIVHHVELCLSDAPKVEPNSGESVGAPCVPVVPCPKCSCGAKQEGATRQKSRYYTVSVSGTYHM